MRDYNEILNNRKLNILTKLNNENGEVQIRAYYNDPVTQKRYWCKFTRMEGWEHLTVSPQPQRGKVPEWEIMCKVKDIFWEDEECCIEYHPRKSQYINNNETCLHIWRPIDVELPEPPTILLGLAGVNSDDTNRLIQGMLDSMSLEQQMQFADKIGVKVNRSMKRGMKR